jgi:PTS system beta-glucosides-specific IIC component
VTAGTPLVTFDPKVIEAAGYPLITPIVILNAKKFGGVEVVSEGTVSAGDTLLALAPAAQPAEAGL